MNGITAPWGFTSQDQLERGLKKFTATAQQVCDKHGVSNLAHSIRLVKGDEPFSMMIGSVPPVVVGSKEEKAVNEIIYLFNSGDF